MKEFFLKWYSYNAWANRRIIGALEQQAVTDKKILSIFAHLVSANFIWLNRFKGLPKSEYLLWGTYDLKQLRAMVEEADKLFAEYVEHGEYAGRLLKYHNYTGDYFENEVEQIMIHLVNHGSYHRGQVALLMREKGYEPVNTDYITYDRVLSGQLKD